MAILYRTVMGSGNKTGQLSMMQWWALAIQLLFGNSPESPLWLCLRVRLLEGQWWWQRRLNIMIGININRYHDFRSRPNTGEPESSVIASAPGQVTLLLLQLVLLVSVIFVLLMLLLITIHRPPCPRYQWGQEETHFQDQDGQNSKVEATEGCFLRYRGGLMQTRCKYLIHPISFSTFYQFVLALTFFEGQNLS